MTNFEKWKNRYNNNGCTKENLQDLFDMKVITYDEFIEITNEEPLLPTLEQAMSRVLIELKTYKWQKLEYIVYDGHLQRYGNEDKLLMLETQELLDKNLAESINWVHSDGVVVQVTEPSYIMNMRLTGGAFTECGFTAELMVGNLISNMTRLEDVLSFDYKAQFDGVFATELNKLQAK